MANPRLERRGPETVVTTIGTGAGAVKTETRAPHQPSVVRSAVSVGAVSDPNVLARFLREIHAEMDRMRDDTASVLSGAVWLQAVSLKAGTNYIEHRLGRVPKGILTSLPTAAVLGVALPIGLEANRFFGVTTVGAQTVSFLVF